MTEQIQEMTVTFRPERHLDEMKIHLQGKSTSLQKHESSTLSFEKNLPTLNLISFNVIRNASDKRNSHNCKKIKVLSLQHEFYRLTNLITKIELMRLLFVGI